MAKDELFRVEFIKVFLPRDDRMLKMLKVLEFINIFNGGAYLSRLFNRTHYTYRLKYYYIV